MLSEILFVLTLVATQGSAAIPLAMYAERPACERVIAAYQAGSRRNGAVELKCLEGQFKGDGPQAPRQPEL